MGSTPACLPGLWSQRNLGTRSSCLMPEAIFWLCGTGFQFQLNWKFTICPNSRRDGVFSVWKANDFGSPLYWTILNSYLPHFTSGLSCMRPAINYSLGIPFLTYFFFSIAMVYFRQRSSSNLKTWSDKYFFHSSAFSNPTTYVCMHLFIPWLWDGILHGQGKDVNNVPRGKAWKENHKDSLLRF